MLKTIFNTEIEILDKNPLNIPAPTTSVIKQDKNIITIENDSKYDLYHAKGIKLVNTSDSIVLTDPINIRCINAEVNHPTRIVLTNAASEEVGFVFDKLLIMFGEYRKVEFIALEAETDLQIFLLGGII